MKKLTFITILFIFASNHLFAQWTTSGNNVYTTTVGNNVIIGATAPSVINASSGLFPGVTPKQEILTGSSTTAYSELVTIRHNGLAVDALSRQLGLVFKLSSESSTGESGKMGGMLLESSNGYANLPALSLLTNNARRLTIDYNGNVGIGITTPQNTLDVNGTIHSKQVNIDLNGWSDYVFKKGYRLLPLNQVKDYIDQNQHLPEIPSEHEMIKSGLDVSEMNKLLMKKVEELTLYLIEMKEEKDKEINELAHRLALIEKSSAIKQ